ncbi:MAG: EF-hand domain-containing protein [Verrucomicrobiota bacterium]
MKYCFLLVLGFAVCSCSLDPHSEEAHGRKLMGLQEKFDRFDYNADGKLTRAEIEQGLEESGITGVDSEELDAFMKAYDVDGDGAISRWESQRAIDLPIPEHE